MCFQGATLDGSCGVPVSGCRGRAHYCCCVAGPSCSGDDLAVAYISESLTMMVLAEIASVEDGYRIIRFFILSCVLS